MDGVDADLREQVTDSGLCALASAGFGEHLTSLTLRGELLLVMRLYLGRVVMDLLG